MSNVYCLLKNVLAEVQKTNACVQDIKLAIGDQATLEELCKKNDAITDALDVMCADCPEPLIQPFDGINVILAGDQIIKFEVAQPVKLTDEERKVLGEGIVESSVYNPDTDQTTVTMGDYTLNEDATNEQVVGIRQVAVEKVAVREIEEPAKENEAVKEPVAPQA